MVFSANSAAVRFGKPGKLYIGATGLTEPTSASSAIPAGYTALGYTTTGSAFGYNLATGKVEVAEEIDAIGTAVTGATSSLTVVMAESTYRTMSIALANGLPTPDGTNQTLESADYSSITYYSLIWDENPTVASNTLRLLIRRALPSGNVNRENRKGTAVAGIPVTFECDIAAGGAKPYKWYFGGQLNV